MWHISFQFLKSLPLLDQRCVLSFLKRMIKKFFLSLRSNVPSRFCPTYLKIQSTHNRYINPAQTTKQPSYDTSIILHPSLLLNIKLALSTDGTLQTMLYRSHISHFSAINPNRRVYIFWKITWYGISRLKAYDTVSHNHTNAHYF